MKRRFYVMELVIAIIMLIGVYAARNYAESHMIHGEHGVVVQMAEVEAWDNS